MLVRVQLLSWGAWKQNAQQTRARWNLNNVPASDAAADCQASASAQCSVVEGPALVVSMLGQVVLVLSAVYCSGRTFVGCVDASKLPLRASWALHALCMCPWSLVLHVLSI